MKDFLLIAPRTAWNIKEVYELFLSKKIRTGHKGHMSIEEMQFLDPDNIIAKIPVIWITTLVVKDFERQFVLTKTYNEQDYQKYDGYDAINIDRLRDIPVDYQEKLGVPLSFFKYYQDLDYEILEKRSDLTVNGKRKFIRLIIRKKQL